MIALAGTLCLNPIMVKEFQTLFAQRRFIVALTVALGAFAAAVLLQSANYASSARDPLWIVETRGAQFHAFCFCVQLILLLLFLPLLAAGSISDERRNDSFDLLLLTGLAPWEIIWGKVASNAAIAFVLILSTTPIAAVSFLHAGITPADMFVTVTVLVLISMLVTMAGVCVSAWSGSPRSSTITSYLIVLLGVLVAVIVDRSAGRSGIPSPQTRFPVGGAPILVESFPETLLHLVTGLFTKDSDGSILTGLQIACRLAAVTVASGLLWAFLFLLAVSAIQPAVADRSTPMRIFALAATLLLAPAVGMLLAQAVVRGRTNTIFLLAFLSFLFLLAWIVWFACGPPVADVRARHRQNEHPLRRMMGWLLVPSSPSGAVFVILLSGVGFLLAAITYRPAENRARSDAMRTALSVPMIPPSNGASTEDTIAAATDRHRTGVLRLARWIAASIAAYTALAWLLSTICLRASATRIVMIAVLLVLFLVPLAVWLHHDVGTDSRPTSWYHFSYLAPVPTARSVFDDDARSLVSLAGRLYRLDTISTQVHWLAAMLLVIPSACRSGLWPRPPHVKTN
jgi:hypothetical protein